MQKVSRFGYIPLFSQLGSIIPIFKAGNPTFISNYQTITYNLITLYHFSKILQLNQLHLFFSKQHSK